MVNDKSNAMEVQVTAHQKSETQKQLMQQWNWTPVIHKVLFLEQS